VAWLVSVIRNDRLKGWGRWRGWYGIGMQMTVFKGSAACWSTLWVECSRVGWAGEGVAGRGRGGSLWSLWIRIWVEFELKMSHVCESESCMDAGRTVIDPFSFTFLYQYIRLSFILSAKISISICYINVYIIQI